MKSQQGQGGQSQENNKSKGVKKTSSSAGEAPQKQQAGYSSAPEQQQIKQEQENMHNERDPKQLDADREDAKPQEADKPAGKATATSPIQRGGTASKPGKPAPKRQPYK